jgi:hypothetical protein
MFCWQTTEHYLAHKTVSVFMVTLAYLKNAISFLIPYVVNYPLLSLLALYVIILGLQLSARYISHFARTLSRTFINDPILRWLRRKRFREPVDSTLDPYNAQTTQPAADYVPSYVTSTWEGPGMRRKSSTLSREQKSLDQYGMCPFELRTNNVTSIPSEQVRRQASMLLATYNWNACSHEPSTKAQGVDSQLRYRSRRRSSRIALRKSR